MEQADIHFYFDPVCPFAWMTSKWVRTVQAQRDYTVDWRFISLRQINAHLDYETHFPPEYEAGHTSGLRLLRVLARTREEHGREMVGTLYAALGRHTFDSPPVAHSAAGKGHDHRGTAEFLAPILEELGLPTSLAEALDEESRDVDIQAESDEALSLTGKDVGTPIIHFGPPNGTAFFGPVISRLPSDEDAVRLWDHVVGLAAFPGFAELKRSLRELPRLRGLGVTEDGMGEDHVVEEQVGQEQVGEEQDWHAGSRRLER